MQNTEPIKIEFAETEIDETADELLQPEEIFTFLLQDCIADADPAGLAGSIVSDFLLQDRPETVQITAFLDLPNEVLTEHIVQASAASIEMFRQKAPAFLQGLKNEIKAQLQA